MTQPKYIDPNSGAAPQPGGMVVGGAESQRGVAATEMTEGQEKILADTQEQYLENPPTSDQEAELQRQILVTQNEAEAKQGTAEATEPAKAETPELAETTSEVPPAPEEESEEDATPTDGWAPVTDEMTKDELVAVARDEEVEGYSTMNKAELIAAINAKREADAK